jgi:AcrR family transcriptional regulator
VAKPVLNRQAFVDAAFTVIENVGIEKLTMRKVASQLDVSPMAMYKHFANKEQLLTATLDEVIARADVFPPQQAPWQQWVAHVGNGMYQSLCQQSNWIPLLGSLRLGSQAEKVTDNFVAKLVDSGFHHKQAISAYATVIQTAIGAACLQSAINHKEHLLDQDSQQIDHSLPLLITALSSILANNATQ